MVLCAMEGWEVAWFVVWMTTQRLTRLNAHDSRQAKPKMNFHMPKAAAQMRRSSKHADASALQVLHASDHGIAVMMLVCTT
jgi:hypothetical protein